MAKQNSEQLSLKEVSVLAVQASKGGISEASKNAYGLRSKVVNTEKSTHNTDRLQQLMAYLLTLGGQDFTGYIKINYTQGGIGRVERFEEILRKRSSREDT
jgi:hypothetical protein